VSSFSDPTAVARYAEGPVRQVPGFHALQQMTALLLAESVPHDGRVLVLGAGGGLELKVFTAPEGPYDGATCLLQGLGCVQPVLSNALRVAR
jgi:hypothetical protein